MRYLVLSDIHANLEALEATLAAADAYDATLVLGDLVGYGADPNAVIECVRGLQPAVVIRGNHDKVAARLEGVEGFNQIAREAIEWTSDALTAENRAWLAALPQGPVVIDDTVEICHGSPFDEDMYVFDDLDALRSIRATRRPLCLFGHTHIPAIFRLSGEASEPNGVSPGRALIELIGPPRGASHTLTLEDHVHYLVNCGAIGQPRDGDSRAGYGIVDTNARTVVTMRIGYDVTTAQMKIIKAGLPDILAKRLSVGR
ncbi:MAG TPA: metallophosphoesterase [Vicinamibacterales bacterium]|nr:metallophosphoesterase [Vicinamibacterales bacterium]